MILFLISLFIFHQKTTMDALKILILSTILTLFFLIMDFAFIQDHPNLMQDNIKKRVSNVSLQNVAVLQKKKTVRYSEQNNSKFQHNANEEYDIEHDQNYNTDQNETCSSCNSRNQYNMYDDNVNNNSSNPYRTNFNPDNDPRYMTNSSSHHNQAHYLEYN